MVQERWPEINEGLSVLGYEVIPKSAVTRENVDRLMGKAAESLKNAPEPEPAGTMPVYRAEEDPRVFSISRLDEGWRVSGKAIERAAAMTYWEHRESVRRFQRLMETIGVEDALREAGIEEGDMVLVGDYELEWQD